MNAAQRNEQEEEDWFRSLLNEEEDDGQQQQQQQEQEEGEYGETMQGHVDCGKMVRGPYVSEYVKGKRERERERTGMRRTNAGRNTTPLLVCVYEHDGYVCTVCDTQMMPLESEVNELLFGELHRGEAVCPDHVDDEQVREQRRQQQEEEGGGGGGRQEDAEREEDVSHGSVPGVSASPEMHTNEDKATSRRRRNSSTESEKSARTTAAAVSPGFGQSENGCVGNDNDDFRAAGADGPSTSVDDGSVDGAVHRAPSSVCGEGGGGTHGAKILAGTTTTSLEEKRRRARLDKNREAAVASRQKKKAYIENLERQCGALQSANANLNALVGRLTVENTALRRQVARFYAEQGYKLDPTPAEAFRSVANIGNDDNAGTRTADAECAPRTTTTPRPISPMSSPQRHTITVRQTPPPSPVASSAAAAFKRKANTDRARSAKERRTTSTLGTVAAIVTLACVMLVSMSAPGFRHSTADDGAPSMLPHGGVGGGELRHRRQLLALSEGASLEPPFDDMASESAARGDTAASAVERTPTHVTEMTTTASSMAPMRRMDAPVALASNSTAPLFQHHRERSSDDDLNLRLRLSKLRGTRKELPPAKGSVEKALALPQPTNAPMDGRRHHHDGDEKSASGSSNNGDSAFDDDGAFQLLQLPHQNPFFDTSSSSSSSSNGLVSLLTPVMCVEIFKFDSSSMVGEPAGDGFEQIKEFILNNSGRALMGPKQESVSSDAQQQPRLSLPSGLEMAVAGGHASNETASDSDILYTRDAHNDDDDDNDDIFVDVGDSHQHHYFEDSEGSSSSSSSSNDHGSAGRASRAPHGLGDEEQVISLLVPSSAKGGNDMRQVYVVILSEMTKYITYSCKLPTLHQNNKWNLWW